MTIPTLDPTELAWATTKLNDLIAGFDAVVVGQPRLRTALLTTLLARGHVLLESVPGLATTFPASTLARAAACSLSRIQCTPDPLPSAVISPEVVDPATTRFRTQLGPAPATFLLRDERNRSSAKTQSAMLEAMQERQTSIGGVTHALPDPFLVLATQNPIEEEGTYVLPQAQMDRFLLKEVIDYPTAEAELEVLNRVESGVFDVAGPVIASINDVLRLQRI